MNILITIRHKNGIENRLIIADYAYARAVAAELGAELVAAVTTARPINYVCVGLEPEESPFIAR